MESTSYEICDFVAQEATYNADHLILVKMGKLKPHNSHPRFSIIWVETNIKHDLNNASPV